MEMIYNFLLDSEEIKSEFLSQLLNQANLIIIKLFHHDNEELKNDYYEMRNLILGSSEDNQE